jgi:hypothetical protein
MKVAELEGPLLDYWVAKALGIPCKMVKPGEKLGGLKSTWEFCATLTEGSEDWYQPFYPSTVWAIGGPIIESLRISLEPVIVDLWSAEKWTGEVGTREDKFAVGCGSTILIAAMRCCVESKFGPEVTAPAR